MQRRSPRCGGSRVMGFSGTEPRSRSPSAAAIPALAEVASKSPASTRMQLLGT
jgi:hypothetical protein